MKKFNYKSLIKYGLIFIYCFFALAFFYTVLRGDLYVNYGFSYAIRMGEVPYVDFNLVILPFAPVLYSLFLMLSKSIIFYYLGQAFLLTLFSYFIFKILKNKAWIYFVILSLPFPTTMASVLFPGYNFLLLFFTVIIIYLEKNNKSDYLIGILLGCLFLTKQTVGGLLCLASIYYLFSDYKKVLKRVAGFLIPILICFLYLLFSHSLYNCFDLCFLGLFDFGHSNFYYDKFYLICFVFAFVVLVYRIIKRPKDIVNYYLLLFSSCVYPLIEYYHVSLFLALLFLVLLDDFNFSRDVSKYSIVLILAISFIWTFLEYCYFGNIKIINYHNLELSIFSAEYTKNVEKLDRYLEKENKNVVYFLRGSENYFYKIKSDSFITYFDLPNYGNYGYNGTKKIISKLDNLSDVFVVVDESLKNDSNKAQQYIKEGMDLIVKKGKLVKKINNYLIYYIGVEE